MNQVCPPPTLEPAHSLFSTSCQQLSAPAGTNSSINNSMINSSHLNNGMLSNGLTFRPQAYMPPPAMSSPKMNMAITQAPSTTMNGPITQSNTASGMSFPLSRPGVMPLVGQGIGTPGVSQRIPLPIGNVDLTMVGGFAVPSRNDGHGMLSLKQEPLDSMSNHVVNHTGMEVSHTVADTVLHERNGNATPKGVWRPY